VRLPLTGRLVALGLATGGRSMAGLVVLSAASSPDGLSQPLRTLAGPVGRAGAAAAAATELVLDKLPVTPPRTQPEGLVPRAAIAATGGYVLAKRRGRRPLIPVLTAAGTAVGAAYAGAWWREHAAQTGLSPLLAAAVEDAVVAGLTALACRDDLG